MPSTNLGAKLLQPLLLRPIQTQGDLSNLQFVARRHEQAMGQGHHPGRVVRRSLDKRIWAWPQYDWKMSQLMDTVETVASKKVLLAAPRGYCAGVDRAVVTVTKALDLYGAPVYVRKQIVHNIHVVQTLEARGAIFVDETDEVPEGATVIFSAHGVSPAVHEQAAARSLKTIDATCPLVTKVHHEVRRFASEDYQILLIGHEGHEEVEGTAGEAPDSVLLIDGLADVEKVVVKDESKLIWLSQTTLSVDETMQTVDALKKRFPLLHAPPSDDICYATQNRQLAVKEIAEKCDLLIVVGSTNSSNSVRLVEVALESGTKASYLIDYASQVKDEWFEGVTTVGVTSGASVPEILVEDLLVELKKRGFDDVEVVTKMEEHLLFSLPVELRKDLRAAQA